MNNWGAWRLVMNGFAYKTVFWEMLPEEIEEANCALDVQHEADEQAARKWR